MKAYVAIPENRTITDPASPVRGWQLPYLTKSGVTVFALENEDKNWLRGYDLVYASPGMVGTTRRGALYVIDSDGDALLLPVRMIGVEDYERLLGVAV